MKFSLVVFLISILYKFSLSQTINPDDSLQSGKKYRIIFFSQKEIVGTVTAQNDKTITLNSGNKVSLINEATYLRSAPIFRLLNINSSRPVRIFDFSKGDLLSCQGRVIILFHEINF